VRPDLSGFAKPFSLWIKQAVREMVKMPANPHPISSHRAGT